MKTKEEIETEIKRLKRSKEFYNKKHQTQFRITIQEGINRLEWVLKD